MPELPEVETIARTLAPQVAGRFLADARVLLPKTFAAGRELLPRVAPGGKILNVSRRGKLLLLELAAPPSETKAPTHILAFHLKMTGRIFVHDLAAEPHKHTRAIFDLADENGVPESRLFFDDVRTFGYCRLMRRIDLADWPFWAKLGPEPLTLEAEDFIRITASRRGKIKALLLDQSLVAGIGNIYADEACFRSGIHPATPGADLSPNQLRRLLQSIQAVLRESIAECGSSIRDYRDANGDAGAFQNLFRVYGRAGMPCATCGNALKKCVVAGRTTVLCPHCQPTRNPS